MKTRIKTGNLTEERRAFLKKSGAMAAMSAFGVGFFTSCAKEVAEPDIPEEDDTPIAKDAITINDTTVLIQLDMVEDLESSGGWILIQDANLLVVNVGGSFFAISSICSHQGCSTSWEYADEVFTCTCHDSKFSTTGEVLQGPAAAALYSFNTSVKDGILTISV